MPKGEHAGHGITAENDLPQRNEKQTLKDRFLICVCPTCAL